MSRIFMLLMFVGTFFSASSQILLKQSANIEHKSGIYEYTYAYTQVPYKYGSIIDTFTYVFVLLLSRFLLGEKITKGKLAGNLIIIAGILIYSL